MVVKTWIQGLAIVLLVSASGCVRGPESRSPDAPIIDTGAQATMAALRAENERLATQVAEPPAPTPLPAPVSPPAPGIGMPAQGGRWEVTVLNVARRQAWVGIPAKPGDTFLIPDVSFRNLDPSQETLVAPEALALIGPDRAKLSPCCFAHSPDTNYKYEQSPDGRRTEMESRFFLDTNFVATIIGDGAMMRASYVFIAKNEFAAGPFRFQFHEIEIPLSDQPSVAPSSSPAPSPVAP